MAKAKGVLPRGDDKVIKSPAASGHFIGVTLRPDLTRDEAQDWLAKVTELRSQLVSPRGEGETDIPGHREDLADVAVGFGSQFFSTVSGTPRFDPPIQTPAGFTSAPPPIPGLAFQAEVLFYVMSLSEARVSSFISGLWETRPDVTGMVVDRGYQRIDGTEVFGYKDGVRNIPRDMRPDVVFVDTDVLPEEPEGAAGGSYLVYLKIVQHIDAFSRLSSDEQDKIMGRRRDGTRVDLPPDVDPHAEPPMPGSEPPSIVGHVRKVGPRGAHDDTLIFRRGLPFVEVREGQLTAGLHFVSFQASLDQFDVILNDWILNPAFPTATFAVERSGADALLDPQAGFTSVVSSGVFFCPPERGEFIGSSLFKDRPAKRRPPDSGRIAVRKRVRDPSNPQTRFERGGFQFHLFNKETQEQVTQEPFVTNSKGHALSPEVPTGKAYLLREVPPANPNIQPAPEQEIMLDSARKVVRVENTASSAGGYGTR